MPSPETMAAKEQRHPSYPAYKDSGVEWIGRIPEHWVTARLRYFLDTSPSKTELKGIADDRQVSFVPMESIGEQGGLDLSQTKELSKVSSGYTYFRDGDVVVAKITPCFENGKGALAKDLKNGVGFGTTELHVLRAGKQLDEYFLFYITVTHPFRKMGEATMYGAGGQKRIPDDFIQNLRWPLPPLPEQRAITAFLDRETGRIDALMEKVREGIDRLQEYRTALISAAVTGKIDVREEVVEKKPIKEIDTWGRMILAIELIRRMQDKGHSSFGRVMLVKMLYVIQHHVRVQGMDLTYHRKDYGPYDPKIRYALEKQLEEQDWFSPVDKSADGYGKVHYKPLAKADASEIRRYFQNSWGDVENQIDRIVDRFATMNATQAEIFATLYAAWNDLLIDGREATDDEIVEEVLYHWHPRKRNISESRWRGALQWMREKDWEPTGFGEKTKVAT